MNSQRSYKQGLAAVSRLWEQNDYVAALAKVEEMRAAWPGNSHLHVLWASALELQKKPTHGLDEAKQALQLACEFDQTSPAGPIELGYFLDGVEDNPQAAAESFADGIALARKLLCEGLIGQAKAYLHLGKREECVGCVMEVLEVLEQEARAKRGWADHPDLDFVLGLKALPAYVSHLKGPFAEPLRELLEDVRRPGV